MNPFLKFLQYNNAVPIAVSVLFLGAGATFAATDPAALYSADQQVVSVDNTYIVNKDLSVYSPRVQITGVTEDSDNYYVAYTLYTIDLKDSVWQDVSKTQTMTVSKADLGPYRDLGLYVTDQLKQITDHELAYLHNVQDIERKNVTQKVVATTYGGLIGKFLDTSTETLPGYTPVVTPPPPTVTQTASAASPSDSSASAGTNASASSANLKIGLQLLGNNPAVIDRHTTYSDLGAVLIDPYGTNVAVRAYQNGKEVMNPTIDTSTSTSYAIEYRVVDPSGATVTVRRIVLVGGATDPGGEITTAGNLSTTPTPSAAPTPAPTPSQTTQTPTQTQTQQTAPTQTTATSSATSTDSTSPATTTTITVNATTTVSTDTASSTQGTSATQSDATTTATSTTS